MLYGYDYDAMIVCPECGTKNNVTFDLRDPEIVGTMPVDQTIVTEVDSGHYSTKMPFSQFTPINWSK